MKKAIYLRCNLAYLISFVSIVSSFLGRGAYLLLFLLPLFMSYAFRRKDRVVLQSREGNIIAGIMTIGFLPLFLSRDIFIMVLYYLLGLLSVKLFVSRTEKDYDHISLLGFLVFSMSTIFLYSIWYLILYALFALLITFYLFIRIVPQELELSNDSLKYATLVFPSIIVLSLILFFILPRNPYMFFGINMKDGGSEFGSIEVGGFKKESLSERVLFRIKPVSSSQGYLYVRSRVFTVFDGKEWISKKHPWGKSIKGRVRVAKNPGLRSKQYRILPSFKFTYVPLVEYPILLLGESGEYVFYPDFVEVRIRKWPRSGTLTVYSLPQPSIPLSARNYPEYSMVPEQLRNDLLSIVKRIDFGRDTLGSIVRFLRRHHRYGKFAPEIDTLSPILEFLLYEKQGECTEFATSFILLVRLMGYKARLVAGFLTREFNPFGKYFTIREKHAHAWAEVFLNGRWIRYDPTPLGNNPEGFFSKLREYYDFIQYMWFTRIVEYNYHDQMRIAFRLMPYYWRVKARKVGKAILFYIIGILLTISGIGFVFRHILLKPEQKAVASFMKYMRRKGFYKNKGETLMEFAIRSQDPVAIEFVKEYYLVKYGGLPKDRLKRIVKML